MAAMHAGSSDVAFNLTNASTHTRQSRIGPTKTASQLPIDPLSKRELEVLALLVEGKSNRDIAEALYLVVGTVKTHTHNIYQKLNVSNRTQAAVRAQELALVEVGTAADQTGKRGYCARSLLRRNRQTVESRTDRSWSSRTYRWR